MEIERNHRTPFELGYRMPAEWEPHEATWLAWPKDPLTFPQGIIDRVEATYVRMIEELASGERVNLLVDDLETSKRVDGMISRGRSNLEIIVLKSADVWMRDYGPIFVKSKESIGATKWIFNAWGNKYDELKNDDETGAKIAVRSGFHVFQPKIVLEGGSIDVNGIGSCLTTKQCLLNSNRNPGLTQGEISRYLRDYLGVTNPLWLDSGIEGDDTDGHVDDIARFVNQDTVVCMREEDPNNPNYDALKRNYELLRHARDQDGRSLNVVPIKMPGQVISQEGPLPASYANFYIGNACVLVPIFGGERERDREALRTLESFFPKRKVVGINCEALVYGFGGIHCVTQQQPSLAASST